MKFRLSLALLLLLALGHPCLAAPPVSAPSVALRVVADGFRKPVQIIYAADSETTAIVEQSGRVVELDQTGSKPGRVILDLTAAVFFDELESGLIGAAFHPKYSENGKFYAHYVTKSKSGLESRISEFSNPNHASTLVREDERLLIRIPLTAPVHLGGYLAFGPDGFLYIGIGDNSSYNDPDDRGQNQRDLFGSILRIEINEGKPYLAPVSNPYVVSGQGNPDVYAVGLRNPRSFTFDSKSPKLYVGEAGSGIYQEINLVQAGANYGWSVFDGSDCLRMRFECLNEKLTLPIHAYSKEAGKSVTVGTVSRGPLLPEIEGHLVFADRTSGNLWSLPVDGSRAGKPQLLLETKRDIAAISSDRIGEIYLGDFRSGELLRLESTLPVLVPPKPPLVPEKAIP